MATEEDEVRALLVRHRKQIIRDINESKLITVLVQKGVLNAINEKLLNDIQCDSTTRTITTTAPIIENLVAPINEISVNNSGELIKNNHFDNDPIAATFGSDVHEKKCNFLIDVIARNGFEKFKEFCYAIESECPQLIEDLINDRLKGSGKFQVLLKEI